MIPAAPLRHHAFVYEAEDEYVDRSVAFLREGLEAGEGGIVANSREGLAVMREALGSDADLVRFCDVASTYTRPARTLATYHSVFLEALQSAPSVRAVAEYQPGPTPAEWEEWESYEAMTNVAYSHLPVWVVCTYNANVMPDPVLDAAWRTHPEMLTDEWRESDRYEDPRELVKSLTSAPEWLPELRSFSVAGDLEVFRECLARELVAQNVPEAKLLDLLVAGTEVATNALRHGGGIKDVRLGSAGGRFVCEVVDHGSGFDDPLVGYRAPRAGTATGLWVARQLAWRVEFFHAMHGFTTRIWL